MRFVFFAHAHQTEYLVLLRTHHTGELQQLENLETRKHRKHGRESFQDILFSYDNTFFF